MVHPSGLGERINEKDFCVCRSTKQSSFYAPRIVNNQSRTQLWVEWEPHLWPDTVGTKVHCTLRKSLQWIWMALKSRNRSHPLKSYFFKKNNKQTFTFTSYLVALHETWCVKDFPFLKYNLIYLSPLGQFCSILTALLTVLSCIEVTGQKTFPSFSLYWLLQSAM